MDDPTLPDEVRRYREGFPEESRLSTGSSRLEFERTQEVLTRFLPDPPCRIVDVGGAAGAYSLWLASRRYEVHLVDASPRLVDEARRRSGRASKPLASASVGDARRLPQGDTTADAVSVMGPLYHLTQAEDRGLALREGARVLRAGGVLVAAAISRYASALDGMARGLDRDPAFRAIRDDDLKDGQHRNRTDRVDYFTTAYFHRPEDLAREIEDAGFQAVACSASRDPDGSLRTWRLAGTMSALAGTT